MTIPATLEHNEILPNGLSLEMIKVEGGSFMMGSNESKDEQPVHEVNVPDFHISALSKLGYH